MQLLENRKCRLSQVFDVMGVVKVLLDEVLTKDDRQELKVVRKKS